MESVQLGNLTFGLMFLVGIYVCVLATIDFCKRRRRGQGLKPVDKFTTLSGRQATVLEVCDRDTIIAASDEAPGWSNEDGTRFLGMARPDGSRSRLGVDREAQGGIVASRPLDSHDREGEAYGPLRGEGR